MAAPLIPFDDSPNPEQGQREVEARALARAKLALVSAKLQASEQAYAAQLASLSSRAAQAQRNSNVAAKSRASESLPAARRPARPVGLFAQTLARRMSAVESRHGLEEAYEKNDLEMARALAGSKVAPATRLFRSLKRPLGCTLMARSIFERRPAWVALAYRTSDGADREAFHAGKPLLLKLVDADWTPSALAELLEDEPNLLFQNYELRLRGSKISHLDALGSCVADILAGKDTQARKRAQNCAPALARAAMGLLGGEWDAYARSSLKTASSILQSIPAPIRFPSKFGGLSMLLDPPATSLPLAAPPAPALPDASGQPMDGAELLERENEKLRAEISMARQRAKSAEADEPRDRSVADRSATDCAKPAEPTWSRRLRA